MASSSAAKVPKGLFYQVDSPLLSTFSRSFVISTIGIELLLELKILPKRHQSVPLSTSHPWNVYSKMSVAALLIMGAIVLPMNSLPLSSNSMFSFHRLKDPH